jgi:4-amino-4-deoxy-L-arabinose transferase-like glycosyltransferase
MLTAEKRTVSQRAMAWRADPSATPRRRAYFEELSLFAMILPVLVGAVLVLALQREQEWSSPDLPLLGAVVLCAAALIYRVDSRRRERPPLGILRIARTVRPGLPAAAPVVFATIAATLTARSYSPVVATIAWIAGIAFLLAYVLLLERPKLHCPTPIDAICNFGLVALALALRLPDLTTLPSFIHSDEAQMGLKTRMAFEGSMPSIFGTTDWWSVPWLGPALQAPLMLFLGDGLTAVRMASVIAGVLATAGLWFLGSEMWSRRAGFVAALLFAVMAPSVQFSRDGVHYMQSIAALVWTVLCYTRATKRYSGAYAALTGVLVGVDIQLYYAARLAMPLILGHAAIRALIERGLLRNWIKLMFWTGLGVVATFLPMAVYYVMHPEAFGQRTDAVFIFSSATLAKSAVLSDYGHMGWLDILLRQAQRVVLGFFSMGDRSDQYGGHAGLLDPVTAALVPAAFALALARAKQSPWLLCLAWATITLVLGGMLTTNQPDAPRLLAALPAICLLIGGLAHTVLETAGQTGLRDAKPLLAIALAGALVGSGALNATTYIQAYPAQAADQQVTLITDIARYLSPMPAGRPVILYDHREFYLAHWTIQLLAPQITGTTVWSESQMESTLAQQHGGFLVLAVDEPPSDLARVRSEYPGGIVQRPTIHDARHSVVAYLYRGAGVS